MENGENGVTGHSVHKHVAMGASLGIGDVQTQEFLQTGSSVKVLCHRFGHVQMFPAQVLYFVEFFRCLKPTQFYKTKHA